MGRRARRRATQGDPAVTQPEGTPEQAAPSRSEAKNSAARARLAPLAEGERPRAVTVGAIVAAGFGAVQAALWLTGAEIRGPQSAFLAPVFSLLLFVTAWGMWRARYWAVLGFQVLLALSLIVVALSVVLTAPLSRAAIGVVAFLLPGGALFWFLVKAMARIQMPERR